MRRVSLRLMAVSIDPDAIVNSMCSIRRAADNTVIVHTKYVGKSAGHEVRYAQSHLSCHGIVELTADSRTT